MSLIEAKKPYITVPYSARDLRDLTFAITPFLFRKGFKNNGQDLSKAEEFAKKGYGSVFLLNHFSQGEIPRIIATVMQNSVLGDRWMLLPVASHRSRRWYDRVGRELGVKFCPIPTEDTAIYLQKHPELETKYKEVLTPRGIASSLNYYFSETLDTLDNGGVVIIFPEGGMRSSLKRVTPAVSTLLRRAEKAQKTSFTLTTIGARIKGTSDHQKVNSESLHFFREYIFSIGETHTTEEYLQQAQNNGQSVDQFALEQLKLVV